MANTPAHRDLTPMSPAMMGTSNLAEQLASSRGLAAQLARLERDINSNPPEYHPGERAYVSLRDVVIDLGLADQQRAVAEQGIKRIVNESRSMVDVARDLRDIGIEATLIPILLRRGQKLAAEARQSGRNVIYKSAPEGAGWEPIPQGRKGGYRRHKPTGGYEYAYPGEGGYTTGHGEPHAAEPENVHDDHAAAEPDAKIAEAYGKVAARAKALGMNVDAKPHRGTTMETVKRLDELITRHEKGGGKKGGGGKGEDDEPASRPTPPPMVDPGDDGSDDEGGDEGDEGGDEQPAPKGDDATLALVTKISETAQRKGVPAEAVENAISMVGDDHDELQTILDYLDGMDDIEGGSDEGDEPAEAPAPEQPDDNQIPGLGHDVPESPHELAVLRERVKVLEDALTKMADHLDANQKALHKQLQREARAVRRQPSPQALDWLVGRIRAFAILALGTAAGFIVGGPVGALLGLSIADRMAQSDARQRAANRVEPGVPDSVKQAAGKLKDKVKGALSKKPAPAVAKSLTRRLRRPVSFGDPLVVEGQIVVLAPRPEPLLKATIPAQVSNTGVEPVAPAGGLPGQGFARSEQLPGGRADGMKPEDFDPEEIAYGLKEEGADHGTENQEALLEIVLDHLAKDPKFYSKERRREREEARAKKAMVAPPPPPGYLTERNPWGLYPGQVLYVRKGAAWDVNPEVVVLPHGAFSWNGKRYPDGASLLKALTGREKPGTTIKRYFGLDRHQTQLLKSLAYQLHKRHPELHFEAHGGVIRATGPLAAHDFPGAGPADHAMLVSASDAETLLYGDPDER